MVSPAEWRTVAINAGATRPGGSNGKGGSRVYGWVTALSVWALPALLAGILSVALVRRVSVYEAFVEGAKEGFGTAVAIIPHVVAMMVAISLFRASGALDLLVSLFRPLTELLRVPEEIVPLAFLRPLTGSGALAYMVDLFQAHGPDSLIGRMASTIQGSTDTTFYVLAVYFGAVGITRVRYALTVGLLADLAGIAAAIWITNRVFG